MLSAIPKLDTGFRMVKDVDLSDGIRAALQGHRQEDIAAALGVRQSTISRWANGHANPSPEQLAAFEDATSRPRGFVLRYVGYLSEPAVTVEDAAASDPLLDGADRRVLLAVYRELVAGKAGGRSSSDSPESAS